MNLRDLTKKYGRNKGLNVEAVQLFACQLLIALRHLRKNKVLHADIKPDNILINHRHNKVGVGIACLCDKRQKLDPLHWCKLYIFFSLTTMKIMMTFECLKQSVWLYYRYDATNGLLCLKCKNDTIIYTTARCLCADHYCTGALCR